MSDRQTTVKLETKKVGDPAAPFRELDRAADSADKSLKKGENTLKEWAGTSRNLHRSLGQMQAGFLSLAYSSGALDSALGKTLLQLQALGDVTRVLKGAGGLTAAFGVSGVALGGIAVAIAGVGAAAVALSPKLQNSLGNALYKITDAAKEQAAVFDRLKAKHEAVIVARGLGVGTAEEEAIAGKRLGLRDAGTSRIDSLEERRASMLDRLHARRMLTGGLTNPFQDQLEGARELKPEQALDKLRAMMGQPRQIPEELNIESLTQAKAVRRASDEVDRLRQEKEDYERGVKARQVLSAQDTRRGTLQLLEDRIKNAAPGSDDDISYRRQASEIRQTIQGNQGKATEADNFLRQQRLLGRTPDDFTGAAADSIGKRLEAANDRLIAQQEKLAGIKEQITAAGREELRNLNQAAKEQGKLAAEALRQLDANVQNEKTRLALGNPADTARLLRISQKVAAGQDLNRDEARALQGNPLFKGVADQAAAKLAEKDPRIAQIMQNFGINQQRDQLAGVVDKAIKLQTDIQKLDVKVTVEGNEDAEEAIKNGVGKAIVAAMKDQGWLTEAKARQIAAEEVARRMQEARANQDANNNG